MADVIGTMKRLADSYDVDRRTTLNRMRENPDPFKVLIGCLVSINIKDEVCEEILEELFSKANSFQEIIDMDQEELERILYRARYRRIKANRLKEISKQVLEEFDGKVPDTEEGLLSLKGVGPKTCNVVLNFAFGKNKIPVDSNTVRISNRIGWIESEKAEDVERFLVENLDDYWIRESNALFMLHGKNTCLPMSPFCSMCAIADVCEKSGVKTSR